MTDHLQYSATTSTAYHAGNLERAHKGDAGYDLYVDEAITIPAYGYANVATNIAIALPPNTWGLLIGRSSAFQRRGLLVVPGVIDNGYRGLLFSTVYNTRSEAVVVKKGERITQLIVMPLLTPDITVMSGLQPGGDGRGEQGFGSTGQ